MTNELIEAVSRAICVADGKTPDYISNYSPSAGQPAWMSYQRLAIAAVRAYESELPSDPRPEDDKEV